MYSLGRRIQHYAAEKGDAEITRYILDITSSPSIQDKDGISFLQIEI